MKVYLVTVFLLTLHGYALVVANSAETNSHHSIIMEKGALLMKCVVDYDVDPLQVLDFILQGNFPEVVSDQFKCLVQCYMVKSDIMDEMGKYKVDNIMKEFAGFEGITSRRSDMEACIKLDGSTPCETAYKSTMCMIEKGIGF